MERLTNVRSWALAVLIFPAVLTYLALVLPVTYSNNLPGILKLALYMVVLSFILMLLGVAWETLKDIVHKRRPNLYASAFLLSVLVCVALAGAVGTAVLIAASVGVVTAAVYSDS